MWRGEVGSPEWKLPLQPGDIMGPPLPVIGGPVGNIGPATLSIQDLVISDVDDEQKKRMDHRTWVDEPQVKHFP